MKKFNITLVTAALGLFSQMSLADTLPGSFLINAQIHQLTKQDCTSNCTIEKADIGYYAFNKTTGGVTHLRLDYTIDTNLYNTALSSKHVNVAIEDIYKDGTNPTQSCKTSDMGQMRRPTSQTLYTHGSYTFENGLLEINIDNTKLQWRINDSVNGRWEPVAPKAVTGTVAGNPDFHQIRGFGYFADSLGVSPLNLKDDSQFAQGTPANSSKGYVGDSYYNVINKVQPSSAWDFPQYNGEFKLAGHYMSDQSVDSSAPTPSNLFSNIWYPNVPAGDDRVFVQKTLQTNYYTALPTLIYENTGHVYKNFNKVPYAYESQAAFDARHCFTQSDAARTQGHTLVHMGVWQGTQFSGNRSGITSLVSLEVAKQSPFPYLMISWGDRRDPL